MRNSFKIAIVGALAVVASGAMAAQANAQTFAPRPMPASPPPPPPAASTQFIGCLVRQTYDVRPNGDMSIAVWLLDQAGNQQVFAFSNQQIVHVTTGTPLTTTVATLQWSRMLDTIERAASSNHPLWFTYDASGHVFGVTAEWGALCR
jgi:hypothetical protein